MADAPFVPRKRRSRRGRAGKRYTKKSGVFATPAGFSAQEGEARESVLKAAEVFSAQAKKNAAKFSKRIPAATYVAGVGDEQAMVVTDGTAAPNAAPFEFGERHPLNWPNQRNAKGGKGRWAKQPMRAYMSRAATNAGAKQRAADVYAEAERQLLAEEFGFTE